MNSVLNLNKNVSFNNYANNLILNICDRNKRKYNFSVHALEVAITKILVNEVTSEVVIVEVKYYSLHFYEHDFTKPEIRRNIKKKMRLIE